MHLAISTYSLARWRKEQNKTLEDTIAWIADAGVEGVEFAGLDEQAAEAPIRRAEQLRDAAAKRSITVAGYCVGSDLCLAPRAQKALVKRLKQDVDVAVALGAPTMRHDVTRGFGQYKAYKGPQTFSAMLKIVAPAVREVTEYGAARGIRTTVENHGFYMQASKRVEGLVKAVDHPNYGVALDLGNFLCVNENPVEAAARLAKYAVIVHAKDFHVRPKKRKPAAGWFDTPTSIALRGAIINHGEVDLPAQFKLLKKAKYSGFVSLEFEGLEEPTRGVSLGLEELRSILTGLKIPF